MSWFEPRRLGEMSPAGKWLVYGLLLLWTFVVLFPLYWVLITSFKLPGQVGDGPDYLPFVDYRPSLHAWKYIFVDLGADTFRPYLNSLIIASVSTVLAMTVGAMAAYALARLHFRPRLVSILLFLAAFALVIWAVVSFGVRWPVAAAAGIALFVIAVPALARVPSPLGRMQHRLGVTTVYVTHDQVEAMTLADRVAILENGVLQQLATPKAIYDDPANLFVARFIGSPSMNLLEGRLEAGVFHHRDARVPVASAAAEAHATLGVRPEDCALVPPGTGTIDATLYALELLGDHVLVTVTVGEDTLTVKAAKDFEAELDTPVGVRFEPAGLYLFDGRGVRLRD